MDRDSGNFNNNFLKDEDYIERFRNPILSSEINTVMSKMSKCFGNFLKWKSESLQFLLPKKKQKLIGSANFLLRINWMSLIGKSV